MRVSDNMKAEYDMWSWIYQEIANIRIEVSRLGLAVRINNSVSPNYLIPYHAHIYSLLIPMSPVVADTVWMNIEKKWLSVKIEINEFQKKRRGLPNARIPFKLIKDLDDLYRTALLLAQKGGLGFKVTLDVDIDKAIESAIVGAT